MRRGRRRWVALGLLAVLACLAWTGVRAVQARGALTEARGDLIAARASLAAGDVAAARQQLSVAAVAAGRARSLTSDPVWRLLAAVPYAGRSLTTVSGVAAAADTLTAQALPAAFEAVDTLDPETLRRPDGGFDLALVRSSAEPLQRSARSVTAVREDLQDLPQDGVLGVVAQARADLLTEVDGLEATTARAAQAAVLAPGLLGEGRLRRYFVLVQQPGEARGTGGLPGAYAVIEVEDGKVSVVRRGSNVEFPVEVRPPAYDVDEAFRARYLPRGTFGFWLNVNSSPDLPTVARLVDARWRASGGAPLDGVVTLDPLSLQQLLEGSAPIALSDGTELAVADVPDYLARGQYEGRPADDQSGRKELLQDVATGAVDRLVSGTGGATALAQGLGAALGSGHMRIAALDEELAVGLREAGLDGALPRDDAPFAYPVVNNLSGGKLESWLHRSVIYRADQCDGNRRRSEIVLRLSSRPPAELPPYVTTDLRGPGQQSRTHRLLTSVYATRGATLVRAELDGEALVAGLVTDTGPLLQEDVEAGLPVWDVELEVTPERDRTLRLVLDEPAAAGEARVLEQPLVVPLEREVDVPSCGARP